MSALLTIAVPTLYNFDQLSAALKSLIIYTDYPFKILVVNNGVDDNEVFDARLAASNLGDLVSVKHMNGNVGWMKAINAALAECDTKFFCMMNDDVVFPPNSGYFWRTLMAHFDDPDVGAVGPSSNFISGVQNLFNLDVPHVCETGLLIGMLMVVRTEEFKEMGGLDDKLPGGDDLDLSIRYLKRRKKLICDRTAYVHHFGQQTGKRVNGEEWDSIRHQECSNNALIRKHGVLAWYHTFGAWWHHPESRVTYLDSEGEEEWLGGRLEKYRGNGAIGVDLGCGPGIKGLEDLNIVGLDLAKKGERGSGGRKFTDADPNLTADATNMPVEGGSVDFVLARHLLEHLVEPISALEEWRRVLKDEGELMLTVPNHEKANTIVLDATHVHAYTPKSLSALLEATGWSVEDCRNVGWGVIVCNAKP